MEAKNWEYSTADGILIKGLHWQVAKPKAVIGIIHGLGEHAARYGYFAQQYNKAGFAVLAYDRRGHGASGGKRGHTISYAAYLQEIDKLVEQMALEYPGQAIILYGHSMGGNLLLNYLLETNKNIKAAVASAPWIDLAFKPSTLKVQLGRLVRSILPALSMKNDLDPRQISRDEAVVQQYIDDPLVHDRITPNTGVSMLEQASFLNTYEGEMNLPLLVMHGTGDQILSHDAAKAFADRLDLPFKSWPGAFHELHQETNKDEIIDWSIDWIGKQLKNA